MAPKKKKKDEAIVGEVVDLRTDFEKKLEEEQPLEPTPPTLTKDELFKLQLTQFQTRAFEAERNLEMFKKDLYLKQIDPDNKLQQMMAIIRSKTDEAVRVKAEYAKVVSEIEARLGINLKEWAYDDLNGQLSKVT